LNRLPCPTGIQETVLQCLRVRDGSNRWKPVTSVWLVDNSPVNCFHGVVSKWERGSAPNNAAQQAVRQKLQEWNLWEAWEQAVEEKLQANLGQALFAKLDAAVAKPFDTVFDTSHINNKGGLGHRWRSVVDEAEREAAWRFL